MLKTVYGAQILLNTLDGGSKPDTLTDITSLPTVSIDSNAIYNNYVFEFANICPVIAADSLIMEVTVDGGSTWQVAGYQSIVNVNRASLVVSTSVTANFQLTGLVIGTAGQRGGFCGRAVLQDTTALFCKLYGYGGYVDDGDIAVTNSFYGNANYSAINGYRFRWLLGTVFNGGTIKLYGLQRT